MTTDHLRAIADALGRRAVPVERVEDQLLLTLQGELPPATRTADLTVQPLDPERDLSVLLLSTNYEFAAPDDAIEDVRRAAHECTQYLLVGHVEVDDDRSVHLRHSQLLGADPLEDDVIADLIGLIDFEQLHFGDYLQELCEGEVGIEEFAALVRSGEQQAQAQG